MEFNAFLQKTQNLPVVDTKLISVGQDDILSLKVQISRWVKSGKLIQLRRGLYLLAEPYRKIVPSEFAISGVLKKPSYISLEKAMEYHGLIPEAVRVLTCVTTKRPESFETPFGRYDYRHIQPSFFWGYTSAILDGQSFFMATPEKALLDFFYLRQRKVSMEYLIEMRLQNVECIRMNKLWEYARRFQKKRIMRIMELLEQYIRNQMKGVKRL